MSARATIIPALAAALLLLSGCRSAGKAGGLLGDYEPEGYEVVFEGNRTFSRGELVFAVQHELREVTSRGLEKSAVDDAAYAVESHYRAEGFPFSRVDYEFEREGRAQPRALFRVTEGPRCELTEVTFRGNRHHSSDELAGFVLAQQPLIGERRTWLVRARLESARSAVEGLYYDEGYTEVAVDAPEVAFAPDGRSARVAFGVREGPRYILRELSLDGVPEEWRERVRAATRELAGRPWLPRRGYELRSRVREVATSAGHPDASAQVEEEKDPGDGSVRVAVSLSPGPLVHIGAVRVEGNERTRGAFVRSLVRLEPGARFDQREVQGSFEDLYGTGLFRKVELELAEGEGEGGRETRDLVVRVDEAPSLELWLEPGYGSYEQLRLGFGATEKNLGGLGRRLHAEATAGFVAQRMELGIQDPWLLGPEIVTESSVFVGRREEPSFTRIEQGFDLRFTRRFTQRVRASVGYELTRTRATSIEADDPALIAADEDTLISLVGFSPVYDSRNELWVPNAGVLARLTFEVSDQLIGSELDYLRVLTSLANYHALGADTTLAASLRSGVLIDTGGVDDFPIQLRFFNGGENTVRSFSESELGPKDASGEPLGGEAFHVASVELRHMLGTRWQLALFYDVGNVAPRAEELFDFRDLRSGVGLGVRWLLPIGPVRLDWGVNPDPRSDEDGSALHLSVGTAF